jgi:hypothetical protein
MHTGAPDPTTTSRCIRNGRAEQSACFRDQRPVQPGTEWADLRTTQCQGPSRPTVMGGIAAYSARLLPTRVQSGICSSSAPAAMHNPAISWLRQGCTPGSRGWSQIHPRLRRSDASSITCCYEDKPRTVTGRAMTTPWPSRTEPPYPLPAIRYVHRTTWLNGGGPRISMPPFFLAEACTRPMSTGPASMPRLSSLRTGSLASQ